MFYDFLKNITQELSKKQFRLISAGDADDPCALFVKGESPVLYFVSAVDFDRISPESYERNINAVLADAIDKNKPIFNNVICINILYSKRLDSISDFADGRASVRDGDIHNVWWYTSGRKLYFGRGQPDTLYGIEECVRAALSADGKDDSRSIREINSEISQESKLKPKAEYPAVVFVITLVNIVIFIIQSLLSREDLFVVGFGINNAMIFGEGQYYRLLTYMFIHSGIEHILFNSAALCIYGSRVEKYCGKLSMILIYIFSGITGGLMSAVFNSGYAVGASGAVFGLLAAMLAVTRKTGQKMDGLSYMTVLIAAAVGIGMGFLETGVDNFGHIGGFIGGLLLGAAFCGSKKE